MQNASCDLSQSSNLTERVSIGIAVSAGISAAACFVAVILLLWQRMYRFFTHRLVLYLLLYTMANALNHVLRIGGTFPSFVTSEVYKDWLCPFHGFLTLYIDFAQLLMQTGLTFHIGCLVVLIEVRCTRPLGHRYLGITSAFESGSRNAKRYAVCLELVYALAPAFIPLLFAWVPFTTSNFGKNELWCWIKTKNNRSNITGEIEQYMLWYGPLTVVTLTNTTVIITTIATICKKAYHFKKLGETPTGYKNTLKQVLPFLAYPIIFQIEYWFALVHQVGHDSIHCAVSLTIIHGVIVPSNGLFAAIAFFVYFAVWKKRAMDDEELRKRLLTDLPPLEYEGRFIQSHLKSKWIDYEEYKEVST